MFANLPHAVVVKRSTGDCGGCGALAVGAVFHGDAVVSQAVLGIFGRFGNGPDSAHWMNVDGNSALAIDSSDSLDGYSRSYRYLYWIEERAIRPGLCFPTSYSNRGAVDAPDVWEWEATMQARRSGAVELRYRVTARGARAPAAAPTFQIPIDRVRTSPDPNADVECVGPEW